MQGLRIAVVLLVVAAVTTGAPRLVAEEGSRQPVPDAAELTRAKKLLGEVYGKQCQSAKTDAQKTAVARKMLSVAAQAENNPAERFVLLEAARYMAVQASDVKTAMEAAGRMAAAFEIDGPKIKRDLLEKLADKVRSATQQKALVTAALELMDEAAEREDFPAAQSAAKVALRAAGRARDKALRARILRQEKAIVARAAAYVEFRKAMDTLRDKPADPEANLTAGRYLCFMRGDWDKGISMLALGSDADLKAVAVQELKGATTPEDQVALGDAWWDLGEKNDGRDKQSLWPRAGTWYREAEPRLASVVLRAKVQKRLREIEEFGRPVPERSEREGPPLLEAPFDAKRAYGYQRRWSMEVRMPKMLTNSIGMRLVLIPPGKFDMGSSKEQQDQVIALVRKEGDPWLGEIGRVATEGPQHRVTITRPFYIGQYEVTVGQFRRFVNDASFKTQAETDGKGGYTVNAHESPILRGPMPEYSWRNVGFPQTDHHPVVNVSWNDALAFCEWLSKTENRTYRLPTEAEWEYACRGGTTTHFYFGNDTTSWKEYWWQWHNSEAKTQAVGQKSHNTWGLYDMLGNVWEMCADAYSADYYGRSPAEDPTGPASGSSRVARGGAFRDPRAFQFRCARRYALPPTRLDPGLGFRVVCDCVKQRE